MKNGRKNKKIPGAASGLQKFLEVCSLLNQQKAKYLILGGVAANLHGLIRATKDIDLFIPKDLQNTEKILKALGHLTWGIAKELKAEEVVRKPMTIIGDLPRIDLLTVVRHLKFETAFAKKDIVKIDRVSIPFVNLNDLILSKDTDRLQDLADIEQLKYLNKK